MRKNQNKLWPLLQPKHYQEADVQAAIETFWDCLFRGYRLITKDEIDMPKNWQPDILACSQEDYSLLIMEVKGNPPNGKKSDAVKQAVGYAIRYQDTYPDHPIRILVVGPYWVENRFEKVKHDGYEVGILSLKDLGQHLLNLATDTLLWQMQNPIGYKANVGLDISRMLEATVREEEEETNERGA